MAAFHCSGQERRAEFSRQHCGNRSCEEDPDVRSIAGSRALQRSRKVPLTTRIDKCSGIFFRKRRANRISADRLPKAPRPPSAPPAHCPHESSSSSPAPPGASSSPPSCFRTTAQSERNGARSSEKQSCRAGRLCHRERHYTGVPHGPSQCRA